MQNVQNWVIRSSILVSIAMCLGCLLITAGTSPAEAAIAAGGGEPPAVEGSTPEERAPDVVCRVSQNYPDTIRQWCEWITVYADETGLSPDLIAAVMWQESGGDALAYSHSGAVGLLQVMPRDGLAANFMCANGPCFASRPTIDELQDPEFNIAYGTRMLAGLEGRQGNLRDALKSYGPHDVGYYYADKVLAIYEQYGEE